MKIKKFIHRKPYLISGPCSAESEQQVLQIAKSIEEAKKGRVEFKLDRTSLIHVVIGKASFTENQLNSCSFCNQSLWKQQLSVGIV